MSIINEALKKTQDHLNDFNEKASGAMPAFDQPAPVSGGERGPRRPNVIIFMVSAVLCLMAWFFVSSQSKLAEISSKTAKFSTAVKNIPRATSSPRPVVAASPVKPPRTPNRTSANKLVLNGIMMNQDKMTALINGEVYETGDYLEGKKINRITRDSVELGEGETLTTLSLQDR